MKKIVAWIKKESKEVGNDYLLLLLGSIIFLILWGYGILEDTGSSVGPAAPGSLFAAYSVFAALIIASKRFRIADKQLENLSQQLETTNQRFEAATRKEDLDRHLAGMDLLAREDLVSQLLGVSILRVLLETKSVEDARDVKVSLGNVLRENWGIEREDGEEREMKRTTRDEIVRVLCGIYGKREEILYLEELDLSRADFWCANLSGVSFEGGSLEDANLTSADLSGANLTSADLSGANLTSADLSGANLTSADLSGANLTSADLSGANLSRVDLSGTTLECADLSGTTLGCADLSGATLRHADLSGVDLRGANLSGANFMQVKGLNEITSYEGIWAYRERAPKNLPDKLIDEVQANLKNQNNLATGEDC